MGGMRKRAFFKFDMSVGVVYSKLGRKLKHEYEKRKK
jgi:hypothetical protein